MAASPTAPPGSCPRGPLGVVALGDGKQKMTGSPDGSGEVPTGRAVRMSRSPGGRHRILGVRLTEEEESQIRRRADECGLSAQRFLVEAAMSGSATAATERRRAQRNAERARLVLASISNNVNQLAKWANTNHAMPADLDGLIHDLGRAIESVEQTAVGLGTAFGVGRRGSYGE